MIAFICLNLALSTHIHQSFNGKYNRTLHITLFFPNNISFIQYSMDRCNINNSNIHRLNEVLQSIILCNTALIVKIKYTCCPTQLLFKYKQLSVLLTTQQTNLYQRIFLTVSQLSIFFTFCQHYQNCSCTCQIPCYFSSLVFKFQCKPTS